MSHTLHCVAQNPSQRAHACSDGIYLDNLVFAFAKGEKRTRGFHDKAREAIEGIVGESVESIYFIQGSFGKECCVYFESEEVAKSVMDRMPEMLKTQEVLTQIGAKVKLEWDEASFCIDFYLDFS